MSIRINVLIYSGFVAAFFLSNLKPKKNLEQSAEFSDTEN